MVNDTILCLIFFGEKLGVNRRQPQRKKLGV